MLVKQYLIFKLSLDYEEFSSMMKRRNELISIGGVVSFHIHMKFDVFSNHMWFWISKLILLSGRNANVNAHYVTYLHTHRTNPWTKSTPNYGCLLNLKNVTFRSGEYERCSWTIHDTLPIYYILIDIVQSLSYQWYDASLYISSNISEFPARQQLHWYDISLHTRFGEASTKKKTKQKMQCHEVQVSQLYAWKIQQIWWLLCTNIIDTFVICLVLNQFAINSFHSNNFHEQSCYIAYLHRRIFCNLKLSKHKTLVLR